jgi:hypothetical protein
MRTLWLASLCLVAACGCVSRTGHPPKGTGLKELEELKAANAFHEAMLEVAERHGLDVSYDGALSRRNRPGVRAINPPGIWSVTTPEHRDERGLVRLSPLLFELELGHYEPQTQGVSFKYGGRRYTSRIREVSSSKEATQILKEAGISPEQFLSMACYRLEHPGSD